MKIFTVLLNNELEVFLMSINCHALEYNNSVADQISMIAEPLLALNISTLGYIKFLKSGEIFHVSNNQNWLRHYIRESLFNDSERYSGEIESIVSGGNSYFLRSPNPVQHFSRVMVDFGLCYGISIYQKNHDGIEMFGFSANKDHPNIINFYINNLELIKRFIVYFKQKTTFLNNDVDKKIIVPKYKINWNEEKKIFGNENFLKQTCLTRFYTDNRKYLSFREAENVYYRLMGMSAKERARMMNVSLKTIDSYTSSANKKYPGIFSLNRENILKKDINNYFNLEKKHE